MYQVTTENDKVIAFFLKESIAKLYCKQGRNLKYKKIQISPNSLDMFKVDEFKNDR